MVWNDGLISVIEKYVKKGSKIYIEGQLQTRKYQGQDGNDRYATEVVLSGFDGKLILLGDGGGGGGNREANPNADKPGNSRSYGDESGGGRQDPRGNLQRDMDDDIPF